MNQDYKITWDDHASSSQITIKTKVFTAYIYLNIPNYISFYTTLDVFLVILEVGTLYLYWNAEQFRKRLYKVQMKYKP